MRILSPFPSGKTNIVLTGKGVTRVAGAGGELFDRCPFEDPHVLGVLAGTVDVFVGGPVAGRDEVQTVAPDAVPDAGAFTLTFDGQTTSSLDWDATETEIQDALNALSNIGTDGVEVAGDLSSTDGFTVTFSGDDVAKKPQVLMSSTDTLTSSSNPVALAITHTINGALPESLKPELDLSGVYQLQATSSEVTSGGNTLVSVKKVEWARNRYT